jgi:hypothetical protein
MLFVWIAEQTVIISLYSVSWLVFITETECVYCAVRTGYFNVSLILIVKWFGVCLFSHRTGLSHVLFLFDLLASVKLECKVNLPFPETQSQTLNFTDYSVDKRHWLWSVNIRLSPAVGKTVFRISIHYLSIRTSVFCVCLYLDCRRGCVCVFIHLQFFMILLVKSFWG